MNVLEEINAYLTGLTPLTTIVSDRIFPTYLPQGAAFPALRFTATYDGGAKDFDGQGETIQVEVQFDCLAATLTDAKAMAQTITDDLKSKTGTFGTVYLQRASLESEFDSPEPLIEDGIYRASQAWVIWLN